MGHRLGVVVIHGMGSQRPGFSDELISLVSKGLGDSEDHLEWQEVHWADVMKEREDRLWNAMNAAALPDGTHHPLDWRGFREFVVHNFGDALAYHRQPDESSAYVRIHAIVSAKLAELKQRVGDPQAPMVVIAHSLGAHIMSNYIWDCQTHRRSHQAEPLPGLVSMVTFGTNIPLFSLEFDIARPITLPAPELTHAGLRTKARWLNFTDRDDILGWPIKPLYAESYEQLTAAQRGTVDRIEDIEINVGGPATSWNPASHGEYWSDMDLVRPMVAHLKALVADLE